MAAPFGLQIGRDRGPEGPEGAGADDREGKGQKPVRPVDGQQHQRHADTGNRRLPLAADVEQPGMEGHGHRKPGEDVIGGVIKRVAKPRRAAERTLEHDPHGFQRILSHREHHEAGDEKRQQKVDEGHEEYIGPARHLFHQAASPFCIPAIRRPSSFSSVSWGRRSPMMRPSNITAMRSESERISSSSTETSRIALP